MAARWRVGSVYFQSHNENKDPFLPFVFGYTENLLGALLQIKEVIRRRVESSEEEDTNERGMTQRLEDILRESSGETPRHCNTLNPKVEIDNF